MIIFDESIITVNNVVMEALFYHSVVTINGDSSEGRYISSKVTISNDSWLNMNHMIYHSNVTLTDPDYEWQDVKIPIDMLVRSKMEPWAKYIIRDGITYFIDPRDSGNSLVWDSRYEMMEDFYLPFSSINGVDWSSGYDMSDGKDFDFLFNQVSLPDRRLRDSYTFSKGAHVGKYIPTTLIQSYDKNNNLASFIVGNIPEDLFIPLEVVQVMGIFDGYMTGGITALWDRNDKELRSYLMSLAVTMGRVSGSIVQMKTAIQHLWKNENDHSPDSIQIDLNKAATFRIGKNWWNYTKPNLQISVGTGLEITPFYFVDLYQRFKISRVYPDKTVVINPSSVYIIYLNLNDALQSAVVESAGISFKEASEKMIEYANITHNEIVPLATFRTDALNDIDAILFYRDALIGDTASSTDKYNALIRSYATKSRSANLFTNLYESGQWDSFKVLIEEIFHKSFAMDTRMFAWHDDSVSGTPEVEELH